MSEDAGKASGLFASARRLSGSMLGLLQSRLELFALDLQEEKLRAGQLLLWLTLVIALLGAALLLAVGTLALFLWQTIGYAGLVGLTAVLFATVAWVVMLIRRRILFGPSPFSASVAEFRKDMECLRDH